MARTPILVAFGSALALACGDDPSGPESAGPVVDCGPDVTAVEVSVSSGLTPTFDWSPRCRVALLLVEEGAHDTWSLSGDEDRNDVAPPVTYGVTPSGLTGGTPEPLLAGHTYEVILWHVGAAGARILAVHEFTR